MLTLRPYQTDLITATRNALRQGFKRPLIVLGCGGGKTICFAYMASEAMKKNKVVWFLVHRQELLDQTIDTFDKFNITHENIIIGMVITVANKLDNYPKPDMIIFDEAHFSAAATWGKIIEKFPNTYIIGLTATPCRLDGKPLGNIYDTMVRGIATKKLIGLNYLANYKYYSITLADLAVLKSKGADYDMKQAEIILSKTDIFGSVINSYRKYADGKKAICYCPTIKYSKIIAKEFKDAGINAVHFDGNTPDKERKCIVSFFRQGAIKILCNVDLISVGFDIPDCECCILLRPTKSTALFIQQSMRAMRWMQGKTAIILDHVGNALEHGLPDDEREWSLENTLKKREQKSKNMIQVRQCLKCFFTFKSELTSCPNCGYINPKTKRELEIIEEIELKEITEIEKRKKSEARRSVHKCKTFQDLLNFEKEHGYKKGWAYCQAKIRKISIN